MPRLKPYSRSACSCSLDDLAEHAADLRAAAEQVRRLAADDVEVLVLGDVGVAVLGELVQLALDHPQRDVAQQPDDVERVVRERQRHRLDVEVVAEEHGDVVAPPRVHREPAAAQVRVVDDVVVDERRGVDELDDGGVEDRRGRRCSRPGRAAISSTAGRMRLPPLVWMYLPICGISSTCDCTWRANSRVDLLEVGADRLEDLRQGRRRFFHGGSRSELYHGRNRVWKFAAVPRGEVPGASMPCISASVVDHARDVAPARSACRGAAPARGTGCRSRSAGDRAARAAPSRAARRLSETSRCRPSEM